MALRKPGKICIQSVHQDSAEKQQHDKSIPQTRPQTTFLIVASIYVVLIVLSSAIGRLPILIPTQWVSVVVFILFTPIFLYSISSMLRPWLVIAIGFPSLALGELLFCGIYGCGGELTINLVLTLSSWGMASLIISRLRTKNAIIAMLIGGLWTFLGLLIPAISYYTLILNWSALYMIIYALITMTLNLILIPFALLLNHALRRVLHVQYIDELLPL